MSHISPHKRTKATQPSPIKKSSDLPISTEMVELMHSILYETNEDGVVGEGVGSHLSQPLSVDSLFFPTAAIVQSTFAAAKPPPSKQRHSTSKSIDLSTSSWSSILSGSVENRGPANESQVDRLAINDYNSRLKVLWLKRKATLEREDGQLVDAAQSLERAVAIHLGPGINSSNYETADLSKPVMTDNPMDLLSGIQDKFFLYEPKIHNIADKIQRWYRKRYLRKINLITKLTKCVRGFLVRSRQRKWRSIRLQCAKLIQRRFRKHLARMHRLATLIKQWYKNRKAINSYKKKLFIYQMARKIQKVFRGYMGRKKAALVKLRKVSALKIQRLVHKYYFGSRRNFIISRMHRKFFIAARKIQRVVRSKQAIERSRAKLLLELLRESIRSRKEFIVIQELLRNERIKHEFYMKTKFGKLQLEWQRHRIQLKEDMMIINKKMAENSKENKKDGDKRLNNSSKKEKKNKKNKDEDVSKPKESDPAETGPKVGNVSKSQTFVTPEIITVLDLYDEYEDGRVPWTNIKSLLFQVSISVTDELIDLLKLKLDAQDNGFFYLTDFLTWFDSPDADKHIVVYNKTFSFEKLFGPFSNQARVQRKTKKKMLQEEMVLKFYRGHLLSLFRRQNSPKFQCCQCHQGFALFTDYYFHFEIIDTVGLCSVKKIKALYYPKYWLEKGAWKKQRQIEYEISRVNHEYIYVKFMSKVQCLEEIKGWIDPQVREHFKWLEEKMHSHYLALMKDMSPTEFCKKYSELLLDHLFPTDSVNTINEYFIRMLAKALESPVKKMWILDDGISREETQEWMSQNLPSLFEDIFEEKKPVKVKSKKESKKVDAAISDYGSNQNAFKQKKKKTTRRRRNTSSKEIQEDYFEDINYFSLPEQWFLFSQKAKFSAAISKLCSLIIRIVRLRIVESQAAIMSLLEIRGLLPRKIDIADSELESLELNSLSTSRFLQDYDHYVSMYDSSVQRYARLRAYEPPSIVKTCTRFISQLLFKKSLTLPILDSEEDRKRSTIIVADDRSPASSFDAYIYANAKQIIFNQGPLGRNNLMDIAKQINLMSQYCKIRENSKIDGLLMSSTINRSRSLTLLSILAVVFVKYCVLQQVFSSEQVQMFIDPNSVEVPFLNVDDLAFMLQNEFAGVLEWNELIRLRDILKAQKEISIMDIAQCAVQFPVKETRNWHHLLKTITSRVVFDNIKNIMFMEGARQVVWMQSRSETRLEESLLKSLPRPGTDSNQVWLDMKGYYESIPGTFWYPINRTKRISSSNYSELISEFQLFHGWKHNRELLKYAKIVDIQQRVAQKKVWIRSRITKDGRKIINRDALLVDMTSIFVDSYLSVAVTPLSIDDQYLLISRDPSSKSPVNRYFHRLLATVVEIWTRLSDSTCLGILDIWEEHQVVKLMQKSTFLTIAKPMPSSTTEKHSVNNSSHAAVKIATAPPSTNGISSSLMRSMFASPLSIYARPVSAIAVDALPSVKWFISKTGGNITMKTPNRRAFARMMLSSSQRRLSKLLTQQTLIYTDFNRVSSLNTPLIDDNEKEDESLHPRFDSTITGPMSIRERESSLVVRCQLLAMRQVHLFLRKSLGIVHCHLSVMREIEVFWNQHLLDSFPPLYTMWKKFTAMYGFDIDNNNYGLPKTAAIIRDTIGVDTTSYRKNFTSMKSRSRDIDMVSYLKYCFHLHCEPQDIHHSEFPMMLTSEVPHVIHFIRQRQPHWEIIPEATIPVIRLTRKSLTKEGVYWLNWDQFSSLIIPLFSSKNFQRSPKLQKSTSSSFVHGNTNNIAHVTLNYRQLKADSIVRVNARARQQAVLIALNVQDITVPETNYRCMVLGLYETAKHFDASSISQTKLVEHDGNIPRELVPVYMSTQWYNVCDIFMYSHNYFPTNPSFDNDALSIPPAGNNNNGGFSNATNGSGEAGQLEKRNALFASFGNSSLQSIIPFQFIHGKLDYSMIKVSDVDIMLKTHVWNKFTYLEKAKRYSTFGGVVGCAVVERVRLQHAMENNKQDIERRGAQYLKELISGVSQFSQL